MENNSLLSKLNDLEARFQEVSTLITDPSVVADMKRYVRLNKEYRELEQILDARKRYINLLTTLSEAKDLLANESDPELREMAREEIDNCEKEIPATEEEIKLLLIPADPQDDKNAILEIRGGTGGDEAAIFAGDLSACTPNIARARVGDLRYRAAARVHRAVTRKLSAPLPARRYMVH